MYRRGSAPNERTRTAIDFVINVRIFALFHTVYKSSRTDLWGDALYMCGIGKMAKTNASEVDIASTTRRFQFARSMLINEEVPF